jgi:quinol monooxygenase YgiN
MKQTPNSFVSIHPYFRVSEGRAGAFRELCERFVEKTRSEPKCLFYGFSFNGDEVHCREGYQDADGLLAHLDNVRTLLEEALMLAEITRLEIHGPESEVAQLRGPLSALNATYFEVEYGFQGC